MKRIFSLFLASALIIAACTDNTVLDSPEGDVQVTFSIDGNGVPQYQMTAYGQEVIGTSSIGLEALETNLKDGFEILKVTRDKADAEWTQPWGENKLMRDHHNELAVVMKNAEGVELTARFRAFEDGVGFRYEYAVPVDSLTIVGDNTYFNFAQDGTSWTIGSYFSGYELPYREQAISATENANTPFTFQMGQVYGSIHEAALYDFPEMNLYRQDSLDFKRELAPRPDGTLARTGGKFVTPWKTIQIARDAVGLINSSLILNLNEPCAIEDVSWIRPQKYVGVWWGMHLGTQVWTMGPRHGATTENALRHIDFAAANNIGGVLFEGWNKGWENWGGSQHFDYCEPYEDFDLDRIAAYAAEKGVSLWMHNETGGSIFEYEAILDKAFSKYQSLGVHYLKTGYAGGMPDGIRHHSQRAVQHYQKVVEKAAEYQIAIDAHEPIKETGIRRTWPNMMTREGARGMEWNAWSEGNPPEHHVMLPFTRLLAGPMDYTPGIVNLKFADQTTSKKKQQRCGMSTICYQLALYVTLYSPLQMAADLPENYEAQPQAFQFIKDVAVDWDESHYLAAEPGQYVMAARKEKGAENWFVGGVTNEEQRTMEVNFDFLDNDTRYVATLYADGADADYATKPDSYKITFGIVTSKSSIKVKMARGGGFAISIRPATDADKKLKNLKP